MVRNRRAEKYTACGHILNRQINAAVADAKLKARLAELGATPLVGAPADFGRHIAAETEKWRDVVKFSGASAD